MGEIAAAFALIGAVVGSFVGAVTTRWPEGRGIVTGRSQCDSCGRTLGPIELIPILSFVLQRGRCRRCRARIAIDQLIAEFGGLIVGLTAVFSAVDITGIILLALFGWTLVALASLDARHHWLPDKLTLPLLATGLVTAFVVSNDGQTDRIIGAFVGYVSLEALRQFYRWLRGREGLGGGDPKLFAAIGAWLGVSALPWVMVGAGLLGLIVVGWRAATGHLVARTDRLPLGTLLSIAALLVMPIAHWLT